MVNEKRLIDARALKDAMYSIATVTNSENIFIDAIIDEIDNAQTVDAVEVVHGRWVKKTEEFYYCYVCSECGEPVLRTNWGHDFFSNYCPNCSAKMDGDGNG